MEKISWTDRVRNKEVLHTVKDDRNMLPTTERRKANWIGHILRRNFILKHIIEGSTEGGIKWREDKEEEVSSYWITVMKREDTPQLKNEAL
jgi:hypothetical protein